MQRRILIIGALGQGGLRYPGLISASASAREDWGWRPAYDLPLMTGDLLAHLRR